MAKEVIELYGLKIYTNTIYQVGEKLDKSAPSGFVERETTKALMDGIKNIENLAVYNEYTKTWDTGLYEESYLLRQAISDDTARSIAVGNIKKFIVEPLNRIYTEGVLRNTSDNNEFWDNLKVNIYKGKVFNTEDPIQLMQLFQLMLRKVLTPKDQESNTLFLNSQYTITNKEEVVAKSEEKAARQMKSYGIYYSLKSSSKENLITLLNFVGLKVSEDTADTTLDLVFKNYIEDNRNSSTNTAEFIREAEAFATVKGKSIVGIYNTLKDLVVDDKVDMRGKEVYYKDGTFVGTDLKNAARNIAENKELKKEFVELQK